MQHAFLVAGVGAEGSDERVIRELLGDVGGPAGDAGHDEDWSEGRDVVAHEVVGRSGWEVEVGWSPFSRSITASMVR